MSGSGRESFTVTLPGGFSRLMLGVSLLFALFPALLEPFLRAFQHVRRFARPLQSVLGLLQPLARLCWVGMMHSPTDRARFPFLQVYGQGCRRILIHQ